MAKLTIFDIVALAKAGYKAADIKELTELEINDNSANAPENTPADTPANDSGSQPPAENTPKGDVNDKAGEQTSDANIDYKSLYEQKCKELETAQQANVHSNQPNQTTKTPTDVINEFMADFM